MKPAPTTPGKRGPVHQSDKQKAKARETMKRLRKEKPDLFNPKKNGATAKFKQVAAERKRIRQAQQPPLPGAEPQNRPPAPAPATPEPVKPAPAPAPAPAAPAPAPAAGPRVIEVTQNDLFSPPAPAAPAPAPADQPGSTQGGPGSAPGAPAAGDRPGSTPGGPAGGDQPGSGPGSSAGPGPAPEPGKADPAVNIALATMVWGLILQMAVMIFGPAMLPQKFKTPAGEIDENENVIVAFCEYFNSLGFTKLSPLYNLVLVIAAYFLLRLNTILEWFKNRRKMKSANSPGTQPGGSGPTPPAEPKAEPQPAPETPAPQQTQQTSRATELGETQTGSVGGF